MGFHQLRTVSRESRWLKFARAEPELLCSVEFYTGSPLPGGRVDFGAAVSGYVDSGSAVALTLGGYAGLPPRSWAA